MIHMIKNLPISPSFLATINSGDTVIFTDNAVFALKQENVQQEPLTQIAFTHINLYVRKVDLLIRNISNTDLVHGVIILDDLQYRDALYQDFAIKSCN